MSNKTKMSEDNKFQLILALVVFGLTIISSILSGYIVFYLTSDKSPTVTIYPAVGTNRSYNFIISNLKDAPADHIILGYKFRGVENITYFLGSIPFLSKGTTTLNLDLNQLQERVIAVSEKEFLEFPQNNYQPFHVAVGEEVKYNKFSNMFDLIISAECKTCKNEDISKPTFRGYPTVRLAHFTAELLGHYASVKLTNLS